MTIKANFLKLLLLTVPVAPAIAQSVNDTPKKPNILWLTIEDTSADEFGCYGNTVIKTPVIDSLARVGVKFTNAISTAPHCSPARSTLITGSYATTYGMDIHRELYDTPDDIFYPSFLREAGYFCTNNYKTDYNTTIDNRKLWDECGKKASYNSKNRKADQPFFAIYNTHATHMGRIRSITLDERRDFKALGIDPERIQLPAHIPDLPAMRSDAAYQLEASKECDQWVGSFLHDLKTRDLEENTIVFFFSDHGGCLPRGKGFPFESGLKVPLIIYLPPVWQEKLGLETGIVDTRLIGFEDFAPTILSLAGIKPPMFMQGQAFIGKHTQSPKKYQFGFRSNQENYHYDPCRTASDGKYKYIRNYIPHKPFCLRNLYQWGMPANLAWDEYVMSGKCTKKEWLQPYLPKQSEMLFDLDKDPSELNNLAGDPKYKKILLSMRKEVSKHIRQSKDLGFFARGTRKKEGGLYKWVENTDFPLNDLISAAELASMPSLQDIKKLKAMLTSPIPEIRFWGAVGFNTLGSQQQLKECPVEILSAINDPVLEVATMAAEAACYLGKHEQGLDKLLALFSSNFNMAYSSLETLSWYAQQKEQLQSHIPFLNKLLEKENKIKQTRMGLAVKVRSLLVNLGELPLSELYTEEDKKIGRKINRTPRQFMYSEGKVN